MFAKTDGCHLAKTALYLAAKIRVRLDLIEKKNPVRLERELVAQQRNVTELPILYGLHG